MIIHISNSILYSQSPKTDVLYGPGRAFSKNHGPGRAQKSRPVAISIPDS